MRRHYSGRSDALVSSSDGEQGFWPSYADMMSAVALILFFLIGKETSDTYLKALSAFGKFLKDKENLAKISACNSAWSASNASSISAVVRHSLYI